MVVGLRFSLRYARSDRMCRMSVASALVRGRAGGVRPLSVLCSLARLVEVAEVLPQLGAEHFAAVKSRYSS